MAVVVNRSSGDLSISDPLKAVVTETNNKQNKPFLSIYPTDSVIRRAGPLSLGPVFITEGLSERIRSPLFCIVKHYSYSI